MDSTNFSVVDTINEGLDAHVQVRGEVEVDITDPVRKTINRSRLIEILPRDNFLDVLLDSDDLLQPENNRESIRHKILKYPHTEPKKATVISLPDPSKACSDPFLIRIGTNQNKTKRINPLTANINKRRIDFLTKKDSIVYIEFSNEFDYWEMVKSIRKSLKGDDSIGIVRCSLPRNESTTSDSGALFTSGILQEYPCQITNGSLRFSSGKESEVVELADLKAFTISWDYPNVCKYVVKVSFFASRPVTDFQAIVSLRSTSTSAGTPSAIAEYRTRHLYTVSLPLLFFSGNEISSLRLAAGESGIIEIQSEDELRTGKKI